MWESNGTCKHICWGYIMRWDLIIIKLVQKFIILSEMSCSIRYKRVKIGY